MSDLAPYSPNGKGRLARPVGEQSTRSTTDKVVQAFDNDYDGPVINAVQAVADACGVTMAQIALAWVLRNPAVSAPIVGATKPHHLQQAAEALSLTLTRRRSQRTRGSLRQPRTSVVLTGPPSSHNTKHTLGDMDSKSEISDFLTSRRAKLSPEQAGVPLYSGARRVAGLRREEVAHLAGVSVDYYARLERGKISGASREVIEAIARALQLDEDERDHLLDLTRISQRRPPRRKPSNRTTVRPGTQSVLDSIDTPAFIQNARLDRLASNRLGRALYSLPDDGSRDRFDGSLPFSGFPRPRFHRDFDTAKHNVVALLHAATAWTPMTES